MKAEEPIDLKRLELGTCFFCDRLVMSRDKRLSRKEIENLQALFGCVPERLGSMIGNKIICKSCKADIWAIAQDD